MPLPGGQCGTHLVGDVRWTDEQQVKIGISAAGAQSAVNHDGGCPVPAEEVNGDPRDARFYGNAGRAMPAGDWNRSFPTRGRVFHARLGSDL